MAGDNVMTNLQIFAIFIGANIYLLIGFAYMSHLLQYWPAFDRLTDKNLILNWLLFALWPLSYIAWISVQTWRALTASRRSDWEDAK